MIPRQRRRLTQPRGWVSVNWDHPVNRRAERIIYSADRFPRELVRQIKPTISGTATFRTIAYNPHGQAIKFDVTSEFSQCALNYGTIARRFSSNARSVLMVCRFLSTTGNAGTTSLFPNSVPGSPNFQYYGLLDDVDNSRLYYVCENAASTSQLKSYASISGKRDGQPMAILITHSGAMGAGSVKMWFDGVPQTVTDEATSTGTPLVGEETVFVLPGNANRHAWSFNLIAEFSDDLSAWGYELTTRPWQILQPARQRMYLDAPAVAGGDAVPQVWAQYRPRMAA